MLVALFTLTVSDAHAFDLTGDDWSEQDAPIDEPFEVNTGSFAPIASEDEILAIWQDSLDTWNAEGGADLYLEFGGSTDTSRDFSRDDGHNVSEFGGTGENGVWGHASWVRDLETHQTLDCDIAFYADNAYGDTIWSVDPAGAPVNGVDVEYVLLHEMGHCIGLWHSEDTDALMTGIGPWGAGPENRHLSDDDRVGLQAIYGAVEPDLTISNIERGDDATLRFTITNDGDGSAFSVNAAADGGAPIAAGDIGARTPVGVRIGGDSVDVEVPWSVCSAEVSIDLGDRAGHSWSLDAEPDVRCGGCGCTSTGGEGVGVAALVVMAMLAAGRRRAVPAS